MKHILALILIVVSLAAIDTGALAFASSAPVYDLNTLAGKVASINNTPGLYLHASTLIEQEADTTDQAPNPSPNTPITPAYVLSSTLDGPSIKAPDVTVNQETNAASQNEPTVAVDPNNSNRIVVGMNDYVTRTWTCNI